MSGRKEEVTEKMSEPFEYFEFIQKPFEQKELIEAIKAAMVKARKPRRSAPAAAPAAPAVAPAAAPAAATGGVGTEEFQALQTQVKQLQAEVTQLKGQLAKMLAFIKQKMQ